MSCLKNPGQVGFLFLGGAKRVAMGRMLQKACHSRGLDCRIVGYELDSRCPLAAIGNVVEGLRWNDPDIFSSLKNVCDTYELDAVIPFVDPAVGIAARFTAATGTGAGLFSPVSEYEIASKMFDKRAAAELFEALSLPIPRTYRSGDRPEGLIAKPRFGSASKGILHINSTDDLAALGACADNYIIQERIDRRSEFTVDCYVGTRDGVVYAASPRVRLEVSGGEAVRTQTVDIPELVALSHKVLQSTGLRGAVTLQFLRDETDGRLMLMEINPRLGGAAVASVHAGADIPELIVADALGEKLKPFASAPGVVVTRYLEDVVFYPESK